MSNNRLSEVGVEKKSWFKRILINLNYRFYLNRFFLFGDKSLHFFAIFLARWLTHCFHHNFSLIKVYNHTQSCFLWKVVKLTSINIIVLFYTSDKIRNTVILKLQSGFVSSMYSVWDNSFVSFLLGLDCTASGCLLMRG